MSNLTQSFFRCICSKKMVEVSNKLEFTEEVEGWSSDLMNKQVSWRNEGFGFQTVELVPFNISDRQQVTVFQLQEPSNGL